MPQDPKLCPLADPVSFTDSDLVDGVRAGSETHFNELYRRYYQRIYRFTLTRVRNHADTEELVQEAFLAVFGSMDGYRGRSSLLAWIYGIAKNTVNNHLRRARSQEERLERARPSLVHGTSPLANATPEDQLAMRRYADAINERLHHVSAWQVEVFKLRHFENLPIGEIARRTARSNDAIRSSLYRVKRLLLEAGDLSSVRA